VKSTKTTSNDGGEPGLGSQQSFSTGADLVAAGLMENPSTKTTQQAQVIQNQLGNLAIWGDFSHSAIPAIFRIILGYLQDGAPQ
jgi:hypothetical protein